MDPSQYICNDFGDIAKCFQRLHGHIDSEIDMMKKKQEETEKKMSLIENQMEFMNGEISDFHNKYVPDLESKLEKEQTERLKLELWGRKWNVIIRGVSGVEREWPVVTEVNVRNFLAKVLRMEETRAKQMLFTAVHRLPSGTEGRRNIILRLARLIDRDDILRAATKLEKGSGYSVFPDLPSALATDRGELLRERAGMSAEDKKKCKLVYLQEPPFLRLVRK